MSLEDQETRPWNYQEGSYLNDGWYLKVHIENHNVVKGPSE